MELEVLLTDITFRYYFLGVHFIIAFVAFQLGFRFLINSIPNFRSAASRVNLAFCVLFFCMGIIFVFKIIYFFFWRDLFTYEKVVYIIIAIGMLIAITLTENIIRKNNFFTILAGIVCLLFIVIPFTSPFFYAILGLIVVLLIYPIQYMQYLITISGGKAKLKLIQLFISAILIILGSSLNVEKWIVFYSHELIFTGLGIIGLGLTGVYKSILNINLFQESDLETALEDLFVINSHSYECLYFLNFSKHIESSDPSKLDVFSSGLIGIESMLQTISDSTGEESVHMIEQNNRYYYLEHGEKLVFCIITNQKLQIVPYFLRKIRIQWESRFDTQKIDWNSLYSASSKEAKQFVFNILHLKRK